MTRSDYVQVCSQCKNRKFDRYHGVVCGLTDKIADFQSTCPSYSKDVNLIIHRSKLPQRTVDKAAGKKHTIIGAIMVIVGMGGLIAGNEIVGPGVMLITGVLELVHGLNNS